MGIYIKKIVRDYCSIAIIAIFFVCVIPLATYGAQTDTPLTATVTVDTVFKLEVDQTVIDFGKVVPGSTSPEKGITITCLTNVNIPWKVSMHAQAPFSFNEYQIPNSNVGWGTVLLKGTGGVLQAGEMSLDPLYFYAAGKDEYITEQPVKISLSFSVDVPPTQAAGKYSTVVVITMHPVQ